MTGRRTSGWRFRFLPGISVFLPAAILAVSATVATGQEDGPAGLETRVFQIHFKEVSDIFLLIEGQVGEAGSIWLQPKLKTISVTDMAEVLDRIEQLISEFDLPPRNVEISIRLILASTTQPDRKKNPPRIRDIIRKIDEVTTRWGNYRLLGSATVIGTEGEPSEIRLGNDYRIGFQIEFAGERQGVVTVRLTDFFLERRQDLLEGGVEYVPVLTTSLNLHNEQLYILGASKNEGHDRAIFVTVTASTL